MGIEHTSSWWFNKSASPLSYGNGTFKFMISNTGSLDVAFSCKYQHTKMLIAIQVFAVATIFNCCIWINRVVYTRCNVEGYISIAGHHDTQPEIGAAPILSHKISANTKETHCIIVDISCINIYRNIIYTNCAWQTHQFLSAKRLFVTQSLISILD